MFCRFCGSELPEKANFCIKCGKVIDEVDAAAPPAVLEDLIGDPAMRAQEDPFKKEKEERGSEILKYGIMSLAFGITGWLSFLGIIFAAIGKSKVRTYLAKFQETEGKATVGKSLNTAGLWVGIGMTIYVIICFVIGLIIGLIDAENGSSGMWY